jgi:UDP-2,3-diacylglucosamine pyrophosphatase LpxH
MQPMANFDQVHVISDLHLGGAPGFQIFDQGATLEALLDYLAASPSTNLALVINGDFVDFLAEPNASYFDPDGAVAKFERIFSDSSFVPVWRGLNKFAHTPNRRLIVVLGNHDLELALPWVRERLLAAIADDDDAARGRVQFIQNGAGFSCLVANASVLCVHGNEVDPWNPADYERIRRIAQDLIQGRAADTWIPNAGSQMVIDVMNGIKRQHPFIDLLKPEEEAVVPVLLALDPGQMRKLGEIALSVGKLGVDAVRAAVGMLGTEEMLGGRAQPPTPEAALDSLLQRRLNVPEIKPRAESVDDLLLRTERRLREDQSPYTLVAADQRQENLGGWGAFQNWILGKPKSEVLRAALDGLKRDRSFNIDQQDAVFKAIDQRMGRGIDYVVTGHTHFERALQRAAGRGFYYNTGTWARLIQFTDEVLDNANRFQSVFAALAAGTMQALDNEPDLVLRKSTVVSICRDGTSTYGELRHVRVTGGGTDLDPVAGTRFVRN